MCLAFAEGGAGGAAEASSSSLTERWGLDASAAVSATVAFGTAESRLVFCATLGCELFAVRDPCPCPLNKPGAGDGDEGPFVVWRVLLAGAAFAPPVWVSASAYSAQTPAVDEGGAVLSATADGSVQLLSALDGRVIWRVATGGTLFSAPSLAACTQHGAERGTVGGEAAPERCGGACCALVATHDNALLALDLRDGSVIGRQPLPVRPAFCSFDE